MGCDKGLAKTSCFPRPLVVTIAAGKSATQSHAAKCVATTTAPHVALALAVTTPEKAVKSGYGPVIVSGSSLPVAQADRRQVESRHQRAPSDHFLRLIERLAD